MTIAALVAGATFAGCTDDENDNKKYDENGNEIVDEPGNTPGGDVELKEKRVAKIWYADADENGTLYYDSGLEFMYKDNRIAKITNYQCKEDGTVIEEYTGFSTIDYGAVKVIMYDEDEVKFQEFDLEDGRAVAGEYEYISRTLYDYEYTDGYLTGMSRRYIDEDEDYTFSYDFQIKDGLWTNVSLDEDGDKGTMTFEMSDVENNLSVDLYYLCYPFADDGTDCLLGLIGNRVKYLPERIETEVDGEIMTEEYQYRLDEEGYITEVICRWSNPIGDSGEMHTDVWLIEYE